MRIAIFIYSMSGGGAERVVSYLLPFLQKKGHQVDLVLMNSGMSYEIPKDIKVHYIENSRYNENGVLKLIKLPFLAFKYSRLIKKLEATHSFSFLTRPSYINIMSRLFTTKKKKIIISERSHPSLQYGYGNSQSKINTKLIKWLYPKADSLICNSKGNATDLIENFGINPKPIKVIHNPIDIESIQKIQPIENFYDKDYFNVVTIGRMDEGKNHELLIKAIEKNSNVRLYILGDGHLRNHLEQITKDINVVDQVFFLGFDSNPYKYLKNADLFMFGSNHEGFPNVCIEAMCCGLPILSTNCKSGPDEILELKEPKTDDIMITKYGVLTPINNIELMKKGLNYFLQNPDYIKKCRKLVVTRVKDFEKTRILENYEKVLLEQII